MCGIVKSDVGLFRGERYVYSEISIKTDRDSRLSIKNGFVIKQMNARLYLTRSQMLELHKVLGNIISEFEV